MARRWRSFSDAVAADRAGLFTFHELARHSMCRGRRTRSAHIDIRDVKAKTTRELEADVVLPMLGFVSDLGPLADWGLTLEKDEIVVNSMMETGRAGIYAAGDVTTLSRKAQADRDGIRRGGDGGESGGALDLSGEEGRAGPFVEHGYLRADGRLIPRLTPWAIATSFPGAAVREADTRRGAGSRALPDWLRQPVDSGIPSSCAVTARHHNASPSSSTKLAVGDGPLLEQALPNRARAPRLLPRRVPHWRRAAGRAVERRD